MMQKLVFATNNAHKIAEVRTQLGEHYDFLSLADIGCTEELPETTNTLEGNATQKARYVYDNYQHNCFSEDTGLEINALGGAPGVITAHYAGPQRSADDNMDLVLQNMGDAGDRRARFRTVICLVIDGQEHRFEGVINGHIPFKRSGEKGFGYDPIFVPEGHQKTFAEMTAEEKYPISHRGKAVAQLVAFLRDRID